MFEKLDKEVADADKIQYFFKYTQPRASPFSVAPNGRVTIFDAWVGAGTWFKLSPNIATLTKLPEEFHVYKQEVELLHDGATFHKITINDGDIDTPAKALVVLERVKKFLPVPNRLVVTNNNDEFVFEISEGLKLRLPHAFNRFTLKSVETDGVWPVRIYYFDEDGVSKIKKEFNVPYKKSSTTQASAFKTAVNNAFKEIATDIETKTKVKPHLEFKFKLERGVIKNIEVPDTMEIVLPQDFANIFKITTSLTSKPTNELAWITCDLVAETQVAQKSMRLLTPTPMVITTAANMHKEYVPVSSSKFQIIEIKMYSNIKKMQPFEGGYNVMIVLHFVPRYKQKRKMSDLLSQQKRICCHDRLGDGLLQSSTGGRCIQSTF